MLNDSKGKKKKKIGEIIVNPYSLYYSNFLVFSAGYRYRTRQDHSSVAFSINRHTSLPTNVHIAEIFLQLTLIAKHKSPSMH